MRVKLPLWLAPTQTVMAITDEANEYANELNENLISKGIRTELDVRNEQISYKVREHSLQKVPYIIAVGKKKSLIELFSVRKLGTDKNEVISADVFIENLVSNLIILYKINVQILRLNFDNPNKGLSNF